MKLPLLTTMLAATSTTVAAASAAITAYPLPALYAASSLYKLTVNSVAVAITSNTNYEYARFAMGSGSASITVTPLNHTAITSASVSPLKLGITPNISSSQSSVSFTLAQDAYVIVKINDLLELVIIADAKETDTPFSNGTGVFNVQSDYHADDTGNSLTTEAFQDAIDDASDAFSSLSSSGASHAVVYVPNGIYTVGNLYLKSNVALYLEPSAVLFFSGRASDYRVDFLKESQDRNVTWWISTEFGSSNIRVFGRGILDGNGFASTTRSNPQIGNNILVPIQTANFAADGITVRNSGSWSVTPIRCSTATFTNIKFLNRMDMGENDCIDVMESSDVTVRHTIGISLDDPYSTKTWVNESFTADIAENWPGSPRKNERIIFDDTISWTRTFGYKVGQGVLQDQTDIAFTNGVVYGCSIGLGINHRYGVSTVSQITFSGLDIESVRLLLVNRSSWEAIFTENADGTGAGPVTDILIQDITVRDKGMTAATLQGLPGFPISGVHFKNVRMPGSSKAAQSLDEMNILARDLYENVTIS